MDVLKTIDLSKYYGDSLVIDNVNISIKKGDIYGLVGRNGAGKTTLMKMILGLTDITRGDIFLWDEQVNRNRNQIYTRVGAHLDLHGFYPELTAYENLTVFSCIKGATRKNAVGNALEKVGLIEQGNKKYKNFSLGMKKRLGLANAIIHEPEFLVLDEPTNGLDPLGIVRFREYLITISRDNNITILISSHLLSEIALMSDRIGILEQGNLIDEKTMHQIKKYSRKSIGLRVSDINLTCYVLENICNTKNYEVMDDECILIYDLSINRKKLSVELIKKGVGIIETTVNEDGLETYFTNLIQKYGALEREN